ALAALALASAACRAREEARAPLRVGVVFDIGGRGDRGFNDGAAEGAQRAASGGGVQVQFAPEGATGLAAMRQMATAGNQLIITVGFLSSHDATLAAREFPGAHFAVIDYALPVDEQGRTMLPPPNLAGLNFREEEGSFVVGALAGLTTRTRQVGFVGGMRSPLIARFEAGYAAGVQRTCPSCAVQVRYAGDTPAGFRDVPAGRRLATGLYDAGADIVFQAAGETGLGVLQAARDAGKLAIGVDVDQGAMAPGHVLTSMLKRIDVAVEDAIRREREGRFRSGVRSYGLAEGGIGYVFDARNAPLIPPPVHTRVEVLRAAIAAGLVTVPTTR
ncbi:MAG TPA: BMP family ABC transporter substrate-binding protein, partial [Gemmatimonadaceae bacterium]